MTEVRGKKINLDLETIKEGGGPLFQPKVKLELWRWKAGMTLNVNVEALENNLLSLATRYYRKHFVFNEDSATIYNVKVSKQWLQRNGIKPMD